MSHSPPTSHSSPFGGTGGSRSGPVQGIQLPEHEPLDMDLDIQLPGDEPLDLRPVTIRVENEEMMHISDSELRNYKLNAVDTDGSSRLLRSSHDSGSHNVYSANGEPINRHSSRSGQPSRAAATPLVASASATPNVASASVNPVSPSSGRGPASSISASSHNAPTVSMLTETTRTVSSRTKDNFTDEVIEPGTPEGTGAATAGGGGGDEEKGLGSHRQQSNLTKSSDKTPSYTVALKESSGVKWFGIGVIILILIGGAAIAGIVCGTGGCGGGGGGEEDSIMGGGNPTSPPAPVVKETASPIAVDMGVIATAVPTSAPVATTAAPTETLVATTAPVAATEAPIESPVATTAPPTAGPTASPTVPGTMGPTSIVPDLSPETLAKEGDFTTPQGLAFLFVSNYPGFVDLPDWRKRQIFAMATFYRSFNGQNWPLTRRFQWLEEEVNECEWASIQSQPCDLDGELEFLGLLNDMTLEGSMPPEVGLLRELEELSVVDCGLAGNATTILPTELSSLTNLRRLSFEGNALTGELPSMITSFPNLQYLHLQDNQWTGTIPADWSLLTNLQTLDLSNTGIRGTIPVSFLALTNLESLVIDETQLTGSIPAELCRPSLTILADCETIGCCP